MGELNSEILFTADDSTVTGAQDTIEETLRENKALIREVQEKIDETNRLIIRTILPKGSEHVE